MVFKLQYFCDQSPNASPAQLFIHPQLFSSSSSSNPSNPPSAAAAACPEGNKSWSPGCRQHLLPLDHLLALRLGIWKSHQWHMKTGEMIGSWINLEDWTSTKDQLTSCCLPGAIIDWLIRDWTTCLTPLSCPPLVIVQSKTQHTVAEKL